MSETERMELEMLRRENYHLRQALEVIARCMEPLKQGKHISIFPNSQAEKAIRQVLDADSHDGRRYEQQWER